MVCPNCGNEVKPGDVFCDHCGCQLSPGKGKGSRIPVIISSLVILLFLVAAIFIWVINDAYHNSADARKICVTSFEKDNEKEQTSEDEKEDTHQNSDNIADSGQQKIQNQDSMKTDLSEKEESDSDYILSDSDSKYLTDQDIEGLSIKEINYAKNEIYARHGRKFDSPELQSYFNTKSWYTGLYDPADFDANYSASVLNDYEKKNAEFLREREFSMNPKGYQLDVNP